MLCIATQNQHTTSAGAPLSAPQHRHSPPAWRERISKALKAADAGMPVGLPGELSRK